jgi:superfamily I DNA and/or RNA helicase
MNLCRHLLLQGYSPDQITILTTYRGQMFHIKKVFFFLIFMQPFVKRRFYFQEKSTRFPDLENVLVTVVDNYQGEENDIILLSLVRSNDSNAIGFLKMENRVNVALSRAKHGLYIVGNMSCLAADGNGTIWKSISKSLSKINSIGPGLPLK